MNLTAREYELTRLSDDELIRHAATARQAGRSEDMRTAIAVLTHRRLPDVMRRVSIRVPQSDVEDVAMEAVASAIKAAFDGTSVGEFVNFLNRIVARRIADFHRSRPARTDPLPEEHEGEEEFWGDAIGGGDPAESLPESIDASAAIRQALAELTDPHREVVNLFVFGGLNADEAAAQINMNLGAKATTPMSADNVHQIASRFRRRARERLEQTAEVS